MGKGKGKKHHKEIPEEIPETDLPEPTPVETDPEPDDGTASDDGMPAADDDDDGFST